MPDEFKNFSGKSLRISLFFLLALIFWFFFIKKKEHIILGRAKIQLHNLKTAFTPFAPAA
jgi:hypothetical protein